MFYDYDDDDQNNYCATLMSKSRHVIFNIFKD